MHAPRNEIRNRFKNFLRTYTNSKGQYKYKKRIQQMCENNKVRTKFFLYLFIIWTMYMNIYFNENLQSSFIVEFPILASKEHVLALFLSEAPHQMLEIFDEVAKHFVLQTFPSYERVTSEIHVRISELPLIEDLRTFR